MADRVLASPAVKVEPLQQALEASTFVDYLCRSSQARRCQASSAKDGSSSAW